MEFSILPANELDSEIIAELVNSAYRGESSKQGWTTEADLLDGTRTDTEAIRDILKTENTTVLKYVENQQILGCVELRKMGAKMYLGMLTVRPAIQGKGIGKKLLEAVEADAKNNKCEAIYMTVISVRKELISWYLRNGYIDTGARRPFAFNDPRFGIPKTALEFVVLEKKLS